MVHFKAYGVSQILTVEWWAFYCCPAPDLKIFGLQMEGPAWIDKDHREVQMYSIKIMKNVPPVRGQVQKLRKAQAWKRKLQRVGRRGWEGEKKCTNPFFLLSNYSAKKL